MTTTETTTARLYDYRTGYYLRAATGEELAESLAAAEDDDGRGIIQADGRSCYVEERV
jgi:hypothetical protein